MYIQITEANWKDVAQGSFALATLNSEMPKIGLWTCKYHKNMYRTCFSDNKPPSVPGSCRDMRVPQTNV